MPTRNTADEIAAKIEHLRQASLTEEERGEVDLYFKGRALAEIRASYGWDVLLEMWSDYRMDAINRLITIDPKNREDVLAEHAVAFTSNRLITAFLQDVNDAIEAAKTMPDVMRNGIKMATAAPPEMSV